MGLTKSERYNRMVDKIFDRRNKQLEIMRQLQVIQEGITAEGKYTPQQLEIKAAEILSSVEAL